MHSTDGAAYFARAVSYGHKMFMELSTGSIKKKLLYFVLDATDK